MDAERALVSKVVQEGDFETVISRGITEDHFADEECQAAFEFISKHVRRYKSPPSPKAFKEKKQFREFEFELSSDPIEYLIDAFMEKVKRRMANEFLMDLAEAAEDPEKAKDIDIHFLDVSRQLATAVPSTTVARFSNMGDRIVRYHEDKKAGNVWGIKMGIQDIDAKTFGIQPHELVICAGWQGRGKSTLMQFIAFNAYLQGKTVLFISLEMEERALMRKFDSMAAELTYRDLKGLELGDEAIDRWNEWSEKVGADKGERDILVIDRIGSRTPMGIYAETIRYKPDLVVVDYISLLEAPRGAGEKSWQQIGHLSRELKLNARMLGIPVIAAAQTNRESTKDGVKLETIAFSSSIGMDSDIVLGLNQDDDQRIEEIMEVVMIKNRDGAPGKALLKWRLDDMQIGEKTPFKKVKKTPAPEADTESNVTDAKKNPFRRGQ